MTQLKSKNNRKFLLLSLAAICIIAGIWLFNHFSIREVTITSPLTDSLTVDVTDIKALQQVLASGEKIAEPANTSDVPSYHIELHHLIWGTDSYDIVKFDADDLIIKTQDNYFQLMDRRFLDTSKVFEAIYVDRLPASATMTFNVNDTISLEPEQDSTWEIKKFDDQWYNASFDSMVEPLVREITDIRAYMSVTFSRQPDSVVLMYEDPQSGLYVIEDLNATEGTYNIAPPSTDGTYTYTLSATWDNKDDVPYHGIISYPFEITYDRPTTYTLEGDTVTQGEPILLEMRYAGDGDIPTVVQNVIEDERATQFFDIGGVSKLIIPTSYATKVGTYTITLDQTTFEVNVVSRAFNVQHLTIDTTIESSTRNEAAYIEFDQKFDPSREKTAEHDLTSGDYILPVNGRLSTEYGETRDVNGSPTSYRHSGVDIAAPRGTEVVATNSGHVTFAEFLILTGNTIVIDHGMGIFSVYFHLDTLNVSASDDVQKGQKIGTVGTTGFSTGPHLHFILSWYDQNLEPGYFLYGEPLTYSNYKALFSAQ